MVVSENYHTHTRRCGHAVGEDREYVEAAIAAGIKQLGFSDHAPMVFPAPPYPADFYSGFRMKREETADYFASIRSLAARYRGQIEITVGLEVEYYPDCFPLFSEFIAPFAPDYLILGQHFTGGELDGIPSFRETANAAELSAYYDGVLAAIRTGAFFYIAHPDVFNYRGDEETYRAVTRRFLEAAKPYDPLLEINRLGLYDGRHYPREAFWELAGELGFRAIVGLDAHDPAVFRDEETPRRALALAEKYGLRPAKPAE